MAKLICEQCGTLGRSKTETKGSIFIEILLWLCFIIPGIIYSIWRLTTRHKVCGQCKSERLVPVNTPKGKKLVAEFEG